MSETWKETNPKDAIGSDKMPLHLFPLTAIVYGCLAMLEGLLKYGRSNFRAIGVRSSIYYDAQRRHMDAWFEGEDIDPDSGLPHLGKALACIAILIDAKAAGKLNDDRMVKGGFHETLAELTPHVKRLKDKHADKTPKHYTIADRSYQTPPPQVGVPIPWKIEPKDYPLNEEWRCHGVVADPLSSVPLTCYYPLDNERPCPRCGSSERKLVATDQRVGFVPEEKMGRKS